MRKSIVAVILPLFLVLGVMPVVAIGSGEPYNSTALMTIPQMQEAVTNEGIVRSIVKAPVVSDGTTAGRATDFVINLEVPLQPDLPGLTLLEGNQIRVTLPEEIVFDNEADFPIKGAGEENCAPGNLQCSTAVLLQGWPQNPIRPPFQKYSLSYDADTNTLVFTALQDLIPDPPMEPGIKQIHLILNGFTNPAEPGSYPVEVTAEVGPDGAEEQGVGILEVLAEPRPSINVTSAFNGEASYRPNTIYQIANPGELSAFPYDFLLWGEDGEPLEGVTIEALNARHSQLVQGEEVIGHIYVDGPAQAEGHQLAATAGSTIINSPVTGFETGRLNVCFKAGTVPGDYVVTLKLNGGNTVRMFVDVVDSEEVQPADPDACQAALSSTGQAAPPEPPDKILFVGNEITDWNNGLGVHLERLAGSANPPLDIEADTVVRDLATLKTIWESIDASEEVGKGDYDVIILQEALPVKDVDTFFEYARKFDAEIKEAGAETVLFMGWPYKEPRKFPGAKPFTIEESAQANRDIATELGADLAPVGLAWQRAMEERPELDMYDSDFYTPSIYGTYLAVNVVYATVFGESPIGLAYLPPESYYPLSNGEFTRGVTEEEAAFLQRIAWETVQEYQGQQ